MSPVLLLRSSTFIDEFSIKKTPVVSLPPKVSVIIERFKESPFCNIRSKLKESHMFADFNNAQQADIGDMLEHCIPLEIRYLTSP